MAYIDIFYVGILTLTTPVTLVTAIRQVQKSAQESGVSFKDYGEWVGRWVDG